MPIYEFRCKKRHTFELMQSLKKRTATAKCPKCGNRGERQLSAFAIVGSSDFSSDSGDFGNLDDMGDDDFDMGGMGGDDFGF